MGAMIQVTADQQIDAYLAKPEGEIKGSIIVIHEVWGLTDHIKSIADRFAQEGYLALAPDLLSEVDFSSVDVAKLQVQLFDPKGRSEAQPKLRALMAPMQDPSFGSKTTSRLQACFNYLYELPEVQQKVAVCGFCFGGTYSFNLAVNEPRLKIALPFYGHADQTLEELKNIKCKVHAFYGEKDENLMDSLDDLKNRMTMANVDFAAKVYPDCGHAFFNDSNPITYNVAAATDSWQIVKEDLQEAFS
jgi:carboxymethylenebutenolidase